ncbi:pentatricopeptide repeat-containing protein At1g26460, mitochondrial [Euphorbia lathyris]|uniref:pentatricopeptide repeat-containing protein At1g26460, mitochondrial n=1 Tax=Euphorbia lathyris TaxID=212925 RepID=UPI0033136349
MASRMATLARTRTVIKTLNPIKSISTFTFVSQQAELSAEPIHADPTAVPLPPNPASGSPLYNENWRNPIMSSSSSIIPLGHLGRSQPARMQHMSQSLDLNSLMNTFADWMTSQRWSDMKQLFEFWIRSLDKMGRPNKPDVHLYNHYLRANVMMGANIVDLLDMVAQMEDYGISPNTASFNLVLKAMHQARETVAAEKLIQRMEMTGNESQPDDESYDLVIGMLFLTGEIDNALKYVDKNLKRGYMLSMVVFNDCVRVCVDQGRLDALASIIEKCKTMDQNKALCPPWSMCNYIAGIATHTDNSKLAYYALEFMAKWIARGEFAKPLVMLSVDEGLIVSTLGTAGRTYNSTLLDASWAILRRSLREKKAPNPESYIAKIYAYASLGNLQRAFSTLREFETAYANSDKEIHEELFSPFASLHPLVVACSKNGFETLDSVYFQLESLSRAEERPYKSVAAINCVILGCANIWDLDRAYQTFEAIGSSFGLSPDIHSYNCLMYAFGKLKKTFEAVRVFEHLISMGIKPNAMSYSLLVDAHLINRDAKSALTVIDDMVSAGFAPSKETLKKVRRRCIREMDFESDERVEFLAKNFRIRMGTESRRNILFEMDYSMDYA